LPIPAAGSVAEATATLPAAGIWSDLESPINEVRLADLETQRKITTESK